MKPSSSDTAECRPIEFDDYVDRYEGMLQRQLAYFSRDRGYFSEYKVAVSAAQCQRAPARVLDFGCGIGLSLPFLLQYFSGARIFATDTSSKSLAHVRAHHPDITTLPDDLLDQHRFDLILVSNVVHHVPVERRAPLFARLAALLSRNGEMHVFEHNPYNPITRRMVANCEFDRDAQLLSLGSMKDLIGHTAGLRVVKSGYCLFFPEFLQRLRPIERFLHRLPLGGQYFVIGSANFPAK